MKHQKRQNLELYLTGLQKRNLLFFFTIQLGL